MQPLQNLRKFIYQFKNVFCAYSFLVYLLRDKLLLFIFNYNLVSFSAIYKVREKLTIRKELVLSFFEQLKKTFKVFLLLS